jgi:hypothetical protein
VNKPFTVTLGLAATAAVTVALTLAPTGTAGAATAKIHARQIRVHPDARQVAVLPHAATFSCQTRPIDGSAGPRCYSPAEIQKAYGVSSRPAATGRGGPS